MTITGAILDKSEKLMNGIDYENDSIPKAYAKAFASGAIEGVVDTCFVGGAALLVLGIIGLIKK